MKYRFSIIVSLVFLMVFPSCGSKENNAPEPVPSGISSFNLSFGRLKYLNGRPGVERTWDEIKEIILFNDENTGGVRASVASEGGSATASSATPLETPVYAVAPSSAAPSMSDGLLHVTIPDSPSSARLCDVPAFASASGSTMQFRTLPGIVKLTIDDADRFRSVTLSAPAGEYIAGDYTLNPSQAIPSITGGSTRSIHYSPAGGLLPEGDYYFAVGSKGKSNSIELKLTSSDGHVYSATGEQWPAAGEVYNFGNSSDMSGGKSLLTAENHPRLIMDDATLEEVKKQLDSNPSLRRLHDIVMANADASIGREALEFKLDEAGRRILDVSRSALIQMFSCAYAYRMTRQSKYMNQAVLQLQAVCSFSSWNCKSHSLDTGEMAAAVGLAFDWLYPDLSQSIKESTVQAVKNFAFTPIFNRQWSQNFFQTVGNWEQVCCGGLVTAALAVYEQCPNEAQTILNQCLASNADIAPQLFAPDGNYPEGYSYWEYGCSFQALMNYCLETGMGYDNYSGIAGISKTPKYFMYMETPVGYNYNYCDTAPVTQNVGLAMWYFAYKQNDASVLSNEVLKLHSNGYYDRVLDPETRLLPMVIPLAAKLDMSDIKAPSSKMYVGNGATPIIAARSAWTGLKSDTDVYFGFKGGKASENHGHMDAGSFVFDAQGVRWAWDFVRPSYAPLENALKAAGGNFWDMTQSSLRWTINVLNNKCHNTLTVNGANHLVNGKAEITDSFERENEYGGTIDITPAVSNGLASAVRTVKLVNDADLVVIDLLKASDNKAAEVEWRMMTPASAKVEDGHITLSYNGKTEYLTVKSDAAFTLCTFDMTATGKYDTNLAGYSGVGFKLTLAPGAEAEFTTTLSAKLQ